MRKASKWIGLSLAVFLLFTPFFLKTRSNWRQFQNQKAALREQWVYCLKASEWMYGQMLWAFDYADAYTRENTWENLLKARAACSSAKLALQQVEFQGRELDQEQYLSLMKRHIEADIVLDQFTRLDTECQQNLITLTCLESLLMEEVFLTPTARQLPNWVENCRKTIALNSEYLCFSTNYLFLQMKEDNWGEIPEEFPIISSFCGQWSTDTEKLQSECADTLDELAEEMNGEIMYTGILQYALTLLQDAQDLSAYLQPIANIPGYFPEPLWLPEDVNFYYMVPGPDTQERKLVPSGEALVQLPDTCYIRCGKVSLKEVEAYEQQLTDSGVSAYGAWSGEAYRILAKSGACKMVVEWTRDETVLYLSAPVGCLISEIYFAALQAE